MLVFLLVAGFTTALAAFLPFESFRNASVSRQALEGLLTLVLGIGFYLITATIIQDETTLRKTLRWIYLGGLIAILTSLIQAAAWQVYGQYPQFLWKLQSYFSSSGLLYRQRVTGVAFEPSWLAHQLNTLYIPLWLGFSVKNISISKKRIFGILSFENILLVLGLGVLFLSFSRIGWLTTLVVFAFVIFYIANRAINHWLSQRNEASGKTISRTRHFITKFGMWVGLLLVVGLMILASGVLLSRIDPRTSELFNIERLRRFGVLGWASKLGIAERLIYWITGFHVFLAHPWFGVGLGGAGFFFTSLVPEFGYALPEVVRYLFSLNIVPNTKNLWVRLLAETGILGFAFYVSWVYLHWREAVQLERTGMSELDRALGFTGKLFILALIMEGFSMDTFGLPYYWIALGLVVAARRISQQAKTPQSDETREELTRSIEPLESNQLA
jgi:O-antigen ligase